MYITVIHLNNRDNFTFEKWSVIQSILVLNVTHYLLQIGLKFNQISFFGEIKPDPLLISIGISVFSHDETSY